MIKKIAQHNNLDFITHMTTQWEMFYREIVIDIFMIQQIFLIISV